MRSLFCSLLLLAACQGPSAATTEAGAPPAEAPATATEAVALPLVHVEQVLGTESPDMPWALAIHGLGDSPEGFWRVLSQHDGDLRVVAVQAPTRWGKGWSWFPSRDATPEERVDGFRTSVDLLASFVEAWRAAHPEAGKPVIMGFSQGGMLSFGLAAHHPELAELVIPVAGLLPPELVPQTSPTGTLPRVRALHGAVDDRIPTSDGEATVETLRQLGLDATIQTYDGVAHGISSPMRAEISRLIATGGAAPADPAAP